MHAAQGLPEPPPRLGHGATDPSQPLPPLAPARAQPTHQAQPPQQPQGGYARRVKPPPGAKRFCDDSPSTYARTS